MSCDECRERLVSLLHDELDPSATRVVAEHVRSCERCAVEYCRMHLDLNAVAVAHELAPPAHVHVALRARVAERFAPKPWTRVLRVLRRPVPAYGLAVAAMVPLLLWLGRPIEPQPAALEHAVPTPAAAPAPARPELSGFDAASAAANVVDWM